MQGDNRFEIRKGIKNHERHNAILQAAYDTVDRMATIFGDLTFGELLTLPLKEWISRIAPNVRSAAEYGLIGDTDEVLALLDRMVKAHGDESFHSLAVFMSSDDARLSREIYSPIYKLWFYHGIRLPEFSRNIEKNARVLRRMNDLLEHTEDFTYCNVLRMPRSKDTKFAMMAFKKAADAFIVYMPPGNGLCCTCNTNGCMCIAGDSFDWCTMVNQTTCSTGSDSCVADDIREL